MSIDQYSIPSAEAQEYFQKAADYEEKEEFEAALRQCEAALNLAPNWAEAYNLRGIILENLNRPLEAITAYREALRFNPNYEAAQENLQAAETEVKQKKTTKAKSPPSTSPFQNTIDAPTFERGMQVLRARQDLGLGILGGFVAALIGAGLWALITVTIKYQIGWMAIGVGFLVGMAVRSLGKGVDTKFGIAGSILALGGCLAGNLLAACAFISQQDTVPFLDIVFSLNSMAAFNLLKDSFQPIDMLFYGFAVYEGYRFSLKRINHQELTELGQSSALYGLPQPRSFSVSFIMVGILVGGLLFGGLSVRYFWLQTYGDYWRALAYRKQGVEFYKQDNLKEADTALEEAIRLYPNSALFYKDLGWIYANQGESEQALASFQKTIQLNPALAGAHDGLGWSYSQLGQYDQAIPAFEEAIRLDSKLVEAYMGLAWAYYHQDVYDKSAETFQQALKLNPNLATAHNGLGWVYYRHHKFDEAIKAFQEAIRIDSKLADAHNGLGRAYVDSGQVDQGIVELEQAVQLNPQASMSIFDLALAYSQRGDFAQSAKQFKAVINLEPAWGAPYIFLASAYYESDQLDLMEQSLQQALQAKEDPFTDYSLGSFYMRLRQSSKAETYLLKAIELSPKTNYFYTTLAYVYTDQKKFDLALQMVDKVLALDKNYVEAYLARSDVYIEQENLDQALKELEQALKLDSQDYSVHNRHYRE